MNNHLYSKRYLRLLPEQRSYVQQRLAEMNPPRMGDINLRYDDSASRIQYSTLVSYFDDLSHPEWVLLCIQASIEKDDGLSLTMPERLFLCWYWNIVNQDWQSIRTAPPQFDSTDEWRRFNAATRDSQLLIYRSKLLRA